MALRGRGTILLQGWLKKRPSRKSKWTIGRLTAFLRHDLRFVVLRSAFERSGVCSLTYYETEEDANANANLCGTLLVTRLTRANRISPTKFGVQSNEKEIIFIAASALEADTWPVSYTHLTLPTIYSV